MVIKSHWSGSHILLLISIIAVSLSGCGGSATKPRQIKVVTADFRKIWDAHPALIKRDARALLLSEQQKRKECRASLAETEAGLKRIEKQLEGLDPSTATAQKLQYRAGNCSDIISEHKEELARLGNAPPILAELPPWDEAKDDYKRALAWFLKDRGYDLILPSNYAPRIPIHLVNGIVDDIPDVTEELVKVVADPAKRSDFAVKGKGLKIAIASFDPSGHPDWDTYNELENVLEEWKIGQRFLGSIELKISKAKSWNKKFEARGDDTTDQTKRIEQLESELAAAEAEAIPYPKEKLKVLERYNGEFARMRTAFINNSSEDFREAALIIMDERELHALLPIRKDGIHGWFALIEPGTTVPDVTAELRTYAFKEAEKRL